VIRIIVSRAEINNAGASMIARVATNAPLAGLKSKGAFVKAAGG
jgi:hypothetical protein